MQWQPISPATYALGESPFWHPQEQTLYWVDIAGKQVLRAPGGSGSVQAWAMPSEPGCMAPAASGGLVIALRHGIFRARHWGGALELLATLDYDTTTVRANDGKCDALGRLWVGTVDETKTQRQAALYCIDARATHGGSVQVRRVMGDALTANGLAWSPDNATLYWADTPAHAVHAFDFDLADATLGAARAWAQCPPKPTGWQVGDSGYGGRPDGAAVDAQGNYYSAMYEGQRLCQFAPDGTLLAAWPTPVPCPTMPCFGGPDLKTLYLTSVRHGRSAQELLSFPLSGCVFSTRVNTPGLPVNFFVG